MIDKFINRILIFLESKLHLDAKYFAKAGFYSSVQQVIGVVCGLIISYFFGHFASKKFFGDYNLVLSIIGFLTIVTLPGIDNYLIRSIGRKFDTSYLKSVKYKFFFSLLAVPILFIISIYYYQQNQSLLSITLAVIAILFPFLAPIQLFNEFYTAKLKFKLIAIFLSLSSFLTTILIILTLLFTDSLPLVVLAYLLGTLIPSLLGFIYSLRLINKSNKIDKDLLSYGLFMTFLSILPWISGYLGNIILAVFLGSEILAIYVVANKLPLYIHKNLFTLYKPLTAKLAIQTNKQHLETLRMHSLKLIIWGILLALPIYLLSPMIIKIIFTEKYNQAIPLAKLLSLGVIPLPITWVIDDIIVFQKIRRPQFYGSIFINSIKILLYLVLIPIYQLYGLAFVFLIDRYLYPVVDLIILLDHNKKLNYHKR